MEKKTPTNQFLSAKITTFAQVNDIYRKGVNLCKGCFYEHHASCIEERLETCEKQRLKYLTKKEQ